MSLRPRNKKLVIGLFFAFFLGVALLPARHRAPVDRARLSAASAARPVLAAMSGARQRLTAMLGSLPALWSQKARLERAERDVRTLRNQVAALEAALAERDRRIQGLVRYRRHVQDEQVPQPEVIAARVIAADPFGPSTSVLIDRGRADGVTPGSGVVWEHAVAGVVTRCGSRVSRVALIDAPECRLPARVARTGERGVTRGDGPGGTLSLMRIEKAPPQAGDIVVSSGLLGMLPERFVIGRVRSASQRRDGLFYRVTIEPAIDLSSLQSLLVVRSKNEQLSTLLSQ